MPRAIRTVSVEPMRIQPLRQPIGKQRSILDHACAKSNYTMGHISTASILRPKEHIKTKSQVNSLDKTREIFFFVIPPRSQDSLPSFRQALYFGFGLWIASNLRFIRFKSSLFGKFFKSGFFLGISLFRVRILLNQTLAIFL